MSGERTSPGGSALHDARTGRREVLEPSHAPTPELAKAGSPFAAWGAPLALVAALGALVVVATFYPGYLNGDPTWQLARARDGFIDDWHPPVMSWVWRRVDRVIAGSGGMFLAQVAMCWAGFALVARTAFRRLLPAGAAMLLMGWFPPVLALVSTIWKDVQHGAAMCLAFALVYRASRTGSRRLLVAAVPLVAYAILLRYNAFPAAVPIVAWAVWIARRTSGAPSSPARTAAWTAAACAALLLGAAAFNHRVTRLRVHTEQHIMLFDLAALSVAESRNLLPDYLQRRGVTLEEMQRTYTPDTSEPFLWVDPGRLRSSERGELRALATRWRQEILRHPGDYLVHRARAFAALLGVARPTVYFPFYDGTPPTDPGLSALQRELGIGWSQGSWTQAIVRELHRLQNTLFFRGWVYLLVDLAAIAAALTRRGRAAWAPALVLGTSGVLYLLPYFFVSPTADFRYVWWGCLAGVLLPWVATGCRREERAYVDASAVAAPASAA